ncbi:MAG: hypothetical protein ACYSVY_14135 [Planctomycetota bacterium]|jgi:hypothetical protein
MSKEMSTRLGVCAAPLVLVGVGALVVLRLHAVAGPAEQADLRGGTVEQAVAGNVKAPGADADEAFSSTAAIADANSRTPGRQDCATGARGACCNDGAGTCDDDESAEDCEAQGGRFGGHGSQCAAWPLTPGCGTCGPSQSDPCGMCCDSTNRVCLDDISEPWCDSISGGNFTWHAGLTCADVSECLGACCAGGGDCTDDTFEPDCESPDEFAPG